VDTEPGEVVFFHGHPTWLSFAPFYFKGLLLSVAAGVLAGVLSAISAGHVQSGWVVVAVLLVFAAVIAIGQLRRLQTTYSITNQRLTIETGLLSRRLHQTRLQRVQNVNSTQSLLERVARIGTVDFDTAGEADFDFAFRGVADPRQIVRTVDRALHEHSASPELTGGV
jgi:uncharacterized membrane protein YdbT with pleckstrin-like domain